MTNLQSGKFARVRCMFNLKPQLISHKKINKEIKTVYELVKILYLYYWWLKSQHADEKKNRNQIQS